MSSKVPIIRPLSFKNLFLTIYTISLYMYAALTVSRKFVALTSEPDINPVFIGLGLFFIILSCHVLVVRFFIIPDFYKGLKMLKSGQINQAVINHFNKAVYFFERHYWTDRWRGILLLSPSKMSFQEMCLVNIAFCYGQLGEKEKSRQYYERTLELFPKSAIAASAIKMIETFSSNQGD